MITEESSDKIDSLIRQGRSFALWRIPGENTINFRMQTFGNPEILSDISELNGKTGFVIAPFNVSERHPIVLIKPNCMDIPEDILEIPQDMIEIPMQCSTAIQTVKEEMDQYRKDYVSFSIPLQKGIQDKLVLSRSHTIQRKSIHSSGKSFFEACRRYMYSYVYLCHTPKTGTWMGGTPEILLSGEDTSWNTVALAGTQRLINGELPKNWNQKNWKEQQLVASYIRRQLASIGIYPEEKGPFSARAGALSHLKSDFRFSLTDTKNLGDILKLLHPTPAVCGLPKEDAYKFILEHEGYDRGYYSGFIGWLAPFGKTDLYVNLRCVKIDRDRYTLFAGGGLLASSNMEEEWQETEDKMKTMQNILE